MKIDLPRVYNTVLCVRIYTPAGVSCREMVSEYFETIDVPDDTFLAICDAKDRAHKIVGSWGYDRTQWMPFKPEYHTPDRLAPRKKVAKVVVKEVQPVVEAVEVAVEVAPETKE